MTCNIRHDVLSFNNKPAPKQLVLKAGLLVKIEVTMSEIANHICTRPMTDMYLCLHTRQTWLSKIICQEQHHPCFADESRLQA